MSINVYTLPDKEKAKVFTCINPKSLRMYRPGVYTCINMSADVYTGLYMYRRAGAVYP